MDKTLSLIILFTVTSLYSQNPEWMQYSRCQDVKVLLEEGNYIWVGTYSGVYKFDKITEKTTCYNNANSKLPCNHINAMAIDSSGNKWIGGKGWLAKFDNTNWTIYDWSNSGMPYDMVFAIAIDDSGNVWIGLCNSGLIKFNGTNWTEYTPYNSGCPALMVNAITFDSKGNKWIATCPPDVGIPGTGGIAKFDGVNWTAYHTQNSGLPDDYIMKIAVDRNDHIWTVHEKCSDEGNLTRFDGTNWIIYDTSNTGLKNNDVRLITVDRSGHIWFDVNMGQELIKYDGIGWTAYKGINNIITSIFIDRYDDPWVGLTSAGVAKFDSASWKICNISKTAIPNNIIKSIVVDSWGNPWIVIPSSVAKFDGSNWKSYSMMNSQLHSLNVTAIAVDKNGYAWIGAGLGTSKDIGISLFTGTAWTLYNMSNIGLPWGSGTISSIVIDSIGIKWIGIERGGLARFDGTSWSVYDTSNSGLPLNSVSSIAIDAKGSLWIGTGKGFPIAGGGVAKFNGTEWTLYNTSNSDLPDNNVISIAVDNLGHAWIGTERSGLAVFDGESWNVYNWSNSPLPDNHISAISIDHNNNKWIGTNGGLARYDGTNWIVYKDDNSGLSSNMVTSIAIDNRGNKWIGTGINRGAGVTVFHEGGVVPIKEKTKPNAYHKNILSFQYNYPTARISYSVLKPSNVLLKFYNIEGRCLKILVNEYKNKGDYRTELNCRDLPSGTYLINLRAGKYADTKKIVLYR